MWGAYYAGVSAGGAGNHQIKAWRPQGRPRTSVLPTNACRHASPSQPCLLFPPGSVCAPPGGPRCNHVVCLLQCRDPGRTASGRGDLTVPHAALHKTRGVGTQCRLPPASPPTNDDDDISARQVRLKGPARPLPPPRFVLSQLMVASLHGAHHSYSPLPPGIQVLYRLITKRPGGPAHIAVDTASLTHVGQPGMDHRRACHARPLPINNRLN